MKLKDLLEKYGEYEVDSKCIVGECEIERIVIDLTKPKPKSVWDLEKGDKYFVACYNESTYKCDMRTWGNSDYEKAGRETGILFLTKEEAEQDLERRQVETLLLKFGGRRWFKNREYNYFLRDDNHLGDGFWIDEIKDSPVQGAIYFDTYEDVEKAIKEIGAERIKQALFEVR